MKNQTLAVILSLLTSLTLIAHADQLPPGLKPTTISNPDIPMIVDATIIGYTEEGYAKIKVNKVYKKGYAKDYEPRSTASIRNPVEELRSEKVSIPTIVRGYGYDIKAEKIAKMSVIMPNRENKRYLFFLSGDLLYGTASNRFEIQEQEDGSLSVHTGVGRKWQPLAELVSAIPTTAKPNEPVEPAVTDQGSVPEGHKNCFGHHVPIEYIQKKPISKAMADSIEIGQPMNAIIEKLGIPSQDSGQDNYIWHYMVEGGTYLLIIGHEKAEKVDQYSNEAIK